MNALNVNRENYLWKLWGDKWISIESRITCRIYLWGKKSCKKNTSIEMLTFFRRELQHLKEQKINVVLPALLFQLIIIYINLFALEFGEAIYFKNTDVIPGNGNGIVKTIIKHHTLVFKIATVPRYQTWSNFGRQIRVLLEKLLPDWIPQHWAALNYTQNNKPCHHSVSTAYQSQDFFAAQVK